MSQRGADWRSRRRAAFAALIAMGVVALSNWDRVPLLQRVDLAVFDSFQRLSPRPYDPETPVRIIAIDRASLTKFGQWPWPRPVIGELVTRLRDYGAAAIGFDIVFSEADRTSPEEIARSLAAAGRPSTGIQSGGGETHDAIFAKALSGAPVVLGAILTFTANDDIPATKVQPSFLGTDARAALFDFPGADINRKSLADAAQGIGSIALTPEDRQDGVIRRTPMAVRRGAEIIPSLTLEMLRVAQGARGYLIRGNDAGGEAGGGSVAITGMRVGDLSIQTSADGALWVRYSGAQPERTISAARVLSDDETIRAEIEGRLVILAATAPGLGDIVATPMSSTAPGAEVHAEILEQIISGVSLARPDWAPGAERLAVIGFGLVVALAFLFFGFIGGTAISVVGVFAAPLLSFFAFRDQGLLIGPTAPVLGGGLAWSVAALTDYLGARRERKEIKRQFEHFVAPEVIAEIAKDPERHMAPGGEERELTILFADVRSFSTISAAMEPQELIDWLNSYLTPMAEAVIEEKGTIDKFIGDAIMAFWNAPRRDANHARQALRGALAMNNALDTLNREFESGGRPLARLGIGLNTGYCSVGRIGARKRLDYTCIGDAVNVAARIEGLTKMYGMAILIGEDTAVQARDFALIEIDRVEVKGREGVPLDIYTVAGDEHMAKEPGFVARRDAWAQGLTHFRNRDFGNAEEVFTVIAKQPQDYVDLSGSANMMLSRINELAFEQPPEDWDGTFRAKTK